MKKSIALAALWVVWLEYLPGQALFERIAGMQNVDSIDAMARQYFSELEQNQDTAGPEAGLERDGEEALFNRWWYLEKTRSFPGKQLRNWKIKNFVEAVKFYNAPTPPTTKRLLVPLPASNGQWTLFGSNQPSSLNFCSIGRTTFVESSPGDPNTLFTGSPTSTLWRSTNGGTSWKSLTDDLPVSGAADLAIDPLNTSVWYLASGDPVNYWAGGAGGNNLVFKSYDAGASWVATPFTNAASIKKIKLDPADPNTVLISSNKGLFVSTNGLTGNAPPPQKIFVEMGDFEFKTSNPDTILAAGTSSIFLSPDGGISWQTLGASNNLPTGAFSRIELAVTPANPDVVYALYTDGSGFRGLYRSTNTGLTWHPRSSTPNIMNHKDDGSAGGHVQAPYDVALAVSPTNPDSVFVGGIRTWYSADGGATWANLPMPGGHADIQNLEYVDGVLYCNSDGSIYRSFDNGASWKDIGATIAISQYYRLGGTPQNADLYLAGAQDNGDSRLTNTGHAGLMFWADGMENAINYTDQKIYVCNSQGGYVHVTTDGFATFNASHAIQPPLPPQPPQGGNWVSTGPWVTSFIFHATDPKTIFYGGVADVFRGTLSGDTITWQAMGNPLTDEIKQLAQSRANTNVLYVARSNQVQRTDNAMATPATWTNITTSNLPGNFTYMVADPSNANHVFVTVGGFLAGNKVFESTNAQLTGPTGLKWVNISNNLPNVSTNCIAYEPGSPNRVYIGTDIGVFYRDNTTAGKWVQFSNGLPMVPVLELEINGGYLAAATYGRGLWRTPTLAACAADLVLTPADDPGTPLSSGIQYYSASNSIESTRQVTGGAETNVNYKAGHHTLLLPGFRASGILSTGSFKVTTGGCETPFLFRIAQPPPKKVNFYGDLNVFTVLMNK